MWISPRFQLLLVKEYQRLKADEQKQLEWSAKRELSKINYRIHTDAIYSNNQRQKTYVQKRMCIFAVQNDKKQENMANKEPGYVYILTNPSFREDWVGIGKVPSISRITGKCWMR